MSLRPIGGIFARLNASGNLTFYDASGNVLATFLSGALSIKGNVGTLVTNSPITTTTSITDVFLGISLNYTPQISTRAFIATTFTGWNTTLGDGVVLGVYRTTGTNNPAGGAAHSGTLISATDHTSATASAHGSLGQTVLDTGLTAGSAYTYSFSITAVTGGTAAIESTYAATVVEL